MTSWALHTGKHCRASEQPQCEHVGAMCHGR